MPLYFNSKDTRAHRIIERCATLHEDYNPPLWCFSPLVNILITLIKILFGPSLNFHRETIICPDGGKSNKCLSIRELLLYNLNEN